jgi:hypothetical protein
MDPLALTLLGLNTAVVVDPATRKGKRGAHQEALPVAEKRIPRQRSSASQGTCPLCVAVFSFVAAHGVLTFVSE